MVTVDEYYSKTIYCSYDDYNLYGLCEFDDNTHTWRHLARLKDTLPDDFEIPNIAVAVAVLSPITERLKIDQSLKLDASNSYGAAKYYWDVNDDGIYDYVTASPYLTLCGQDYDERNVSGDYLTWKELEFLGYSVGETLNVKLGVATETGTATLDAQTANVKDLIRDERSATLAYATKNQSAKVANDSNAVGALNVSFDEGSVATQAQSNTVETIAKRVVYDSSYQKGAELEIDGETFKLEYVVSNDVDSKFYAQVWVPVDENSEKSPIMAMRGTIKSSGYSIAEDANPRGAGFDDFHNGEDLKEGALNDITKIDLDDENKIKNCLLKIAKEFGDKDKPLIVTGRSLGGGQALRLTAYATEAGITIHEVQTYNAVGISNFEAVKFNDAYLETTVTNYVVYGDPVSLAGDSFLSGPKIDNVVYKTAAGFNKHSGSDENLYQNRTFETHYPSYTFNSPLFAYSYKDFFTFCWTELFKPRGKALRPG